MMFMMMIKMKQFIDLINTGTSRYFPLQISMYYKDQLWTLFTYAFIFCYNMLLNIFRLKTYLSEPHKYPFQNILKKLSF